MAAVFLAQDLHLTCKVAVKVMLPGLAYTERMWDRFLYFVMKYIQKGNAVVMDFGIARTLDTPIELQIAHMQELPRNIREPRPDLSLGLGASTLAVQHAGRSRGRHPPSTAHRSPATAR